MLTDQMKREGRFLFRWRSYLPIFMLPLLVVGLSGFQLPGGSYELDLLREFSWFALALLGLAVRTLVAGAVPRGTSGRNTARIKAESLNTSGLYSLVRHPLYLANFIIFLAVLANIGSWHIVAIGSLAYWLYYERIIIAEESMLHQRYGDRFTQWAGRTPTIWPRFANWQPPLLPFSFRTAVRREYTTLFAIISAFTIIETVGHSIVDGRLHHEPIWTGIFAVALIMYMVCRFLKKHTRLLQVEGR